MMRIHRILFLLLAAGIAGCNNETVQVAPVPPPPATETAAAADDTAAPAMASCADLASLAPADTVITLTEVVAAGAFEAPNTPPMGPAADFSSLPAFCRVAGSIHPTPDSDIRFELWLPLENWNGKFMQTGNGGAAGSIVLTSLADPLRRGYAVTNTDTGHQGGGSGFVWAQQTPEKLTDFAYRAVHELTLKGKALTTAYYGYAPRLSYFNGCSTGGRQALKEAQMFPEDYDGIIAGAPANNWSRLMALSIAIQNDIGENGLRPQNLGLLKEAAIASCDTLDGVQDRVITDTAACDFDPLALQCAAGETEQCLSATEVDAARRLYAGLVNSEGEVLMPGTGPASEPLWGAYASPAFTIGTNYFRSVVKNDMAWDPASFDADTDVPEALAMENGSITAMDPDLNAFLDRGGKLLLYHGTTDGLIPAGNTVNYFNEVTTALGTAKTGAGIRFYLVPGMDHCAGGEGAWAVDWLDALETWVERDEAPAAIAASHPAAPDAPDSGFTRPACPYPSVPEYSGDGDATLGENFVCEAP